MTREELEHIIRASAEVTQEYEFVIVGSQSISAPYPTPKRSSRCLLRQTSTR